MSDNNQTSNHLAFGTTSSNSIVKQSGAANGISNSVIIKKQITPGIFEDDLTDPDDVALSEAWKSHIKETVTDVSDLFKDGTFIKKPPRDSIDIIVMPVSIDIFEKSKFGSKDEPKVTAKVWLIERGLSDAPGSNDNKTPSTTNPNKILLPQRCYLVIGGFSETEIKPTLVPTSKLFAVHHIFDYMDELRRSCVNLEKKKASGSENDKSIPMEKFGDLMEVDESTSDNTTNGTVIADTTSPTILLDSVPDVLKNSALPNALKTSLLPKCILRHCPEYHINTLAEQDAIDNKKGADKKVKSDPEKSFDRKPPKKDSAELKQFVIQSLKNPVIAEIVCATYAEWVDAINTKREISVQSLVSFKQTKNSPTLSLYSFNKIFNFQAQCGIHALENPVQSKYVKRIPNFNYQTIKEESTIRIPQLLEVFMGASNYTKEYMHIDTITQKARELLISSGEHPNMFSAMRTFDVNIPIVHVDDSHLWQCTKGKNNTAAAVFTIPINTKAKVIDPKQWYCLTGPNKNIKNACMRVPLYGATWKGKLVTRNPSDNMWYVHVDTLKTIQISMPIWGSTIKQFGFDPEKDVDFWISLGPKITQNITAIAHCAIDQEKSVALQNGIKSLWDTREINQTDQEEKEQLLRDGELIPGKLYKYETPEQSTKAVQYIINKAQPEIGLACILKTPIWDINSIYRRMGLPISRDRALWMLSKYFQNGMTGSKECQEFGVVNLSRKYEKGAKKTGSTSDAIHFDDVNPQAFDYFFISDEYDIPDSIKRELPLIDPKQTDLIFTDEFRVASESSDDKVKKDFFLKHKIDKTHIIRKIKCSFSKNFGQHKMILAIRKPESDEDKNTAIIKFSSKLEQYSRQSSTTSTDMLPSGSSKLPQITSNNTVHSTSSLQITDGKDTTDQDLMMEDIYTTTTTTDNHIFSEDSQSVQTTKAVKKQKGKQHQQSKKENDKKRPHSDIEKEFGEDIENSDDEEEEKSSSSKSKGKSPAAKPTGSKKRKVTGKKKQDVNSSNVYEEGTDPGMYSGMFITEEEASLLDR